MIPKWLDWFQKAKASERLAWLREKAPPRKSSLAYRLRYWASHNPELPGQLILDLYEAANVIEEKHYARRP